MREYQLAGLNWLIRLYDNGINGILADESACMLLRACHASHSRDVAHACLAAQWGWARRAGSFGFWLKVN